MADLELRLAAGPLPRWLSRIRVVLAPGLRVAPDPGPWAGALVLVEGGALELEGASGRRVRLEAGAVLWLDGLGLRALRNPGAEPTTLVAVARRRGAGPEEAAPSRCRP